MSKHDVSEAIAAFVRGRIGIPREELRAAFPRRTTSVESLLVAMGYVARDSKRGRNLSPDGALRRMEALKRAQASRSRKAAERRIARCLAEIAEAEARLAAVEGSR